MIKKQLTEYFVRLFPGEYSFWRLFVYIYVKLNFKFLFSVRNWVQLFIYIWTCDKLRMVKNLKVSGKSLNFGLLF